MAIRDRRHDVVLVGHRGCRLAFESLERDPHGNRTRFLQHTTATSGVALRVADSGEHSVSPEDFTRADPHALQHHVILERDNAIPLKGDDASWSVSITNSIDVMMPTP